MMYDYDGMAETRSLYIHWPFCPYKCHFCPFVALASHDSYMPSYHAALLKEITAFTVAQKEKRFIETIFLGGGTPSTYPIPLLIELFELLQTGFNCADDAEITIEVNPGTVTKEALQEWSCLGINRLSVGVQVLNDAVLQRLNRHQKTADVIGLIEDAAVLFKNISVDLILGLPDVDKDEWGKMLHQVAQWPIAHISLYFLTVHEDTPLYFKVKTGTIVLPHEERMIDLYYWSCDVLESYGFERYELSNFAKVGHMSRHNTVYWERKPYKGFGLGACSFDGNHRIQNEKNLMTYIKNISLGASVNFFSERLSAKQIFLEKLMLGLRRSRGVSYQDITDFLTEGEQKLFHDRLNEFAKQGHLYKEHDTVRLTNTGLMLENYIVCQLMQ